MKHQTTLNHWNNLVKGYRTHKQEESDKAYQDDIEVLKISRIAFIFNFIKERKNKKGSI